MARAKALWTNLPNYTEAVANPSEHSLLVEAGRKWLARRCAVVLTELVTSQYEQPDVIGWDQWRSTVIECKASRSDFFSDKKKIFRQFSDMGVGCERYYLTPKGLIDSTEIPEGWGLLEYCGGSIKKIFRSNEFNPNQNVELSLLLSTIRRLGVSSTATCSIRCYTIENKKKATLSVRKDEPQCS